METIPETPTVFRHRIRAPKLFPSKDGVTGDLEQHHPDRYDIVTLSIACLIVPIFIVVAIFSGFRKTVMAIPTILLPTIMIWMIITMITNKDMIIRLGRAPSCLLLVSIFILTIDNLFVTIGSLHMLLDIFLIIGISSIVVIVYAVVVR